jgi:hypothetical protein
MTKGNEKGAGNALKKAKTTAEASDVVMNKYERPAEFAKIQSGKKRQ